MCVRRCKRGEGKEDVRNVTCEEVRRYESPEWICGYICQAISRQTRNLKREKLRKDRVNMSNIPRSGCGACNER